MNKRSYIFFISFIGCLVCGEEIYVNRSNNAYISAGFMCNITRSFTITKDEILVATITFYSEECETFINPTFINRLSILQNSTNYTICLSNVSRLDAGKYNFHRYSNLTSSSTLYVLEKPNSPKLTILNNGTVDSIPAAIECHATSNSVPNGLRMSYTWLINSFEIDVNNTKYYYLNGSNSVLHIHVDRDDADDSYSCVATEMHGQSASSNYGVSITPRSPPLVHITPNTSTVKIMEQDSLTLSCTTSGAVPEVSSYAWYKDTDVLEISQSKNLTIHNITRQDAGHYNCTASNGLQRTGSNIIGIDVLFGPYIDVMMPVSQEDGFGLNITCNVSSNPPVEDDNVFWKRDNSSQFSLHGRTLIIPHINKKDHGQFKCSVNLTLEPTYSPSLVTHDSKILDVNVLYGPEVSSINTTSTEEGKNVNISCQVDSNPLPTNDDVTWYLRNSVDHVSTHLGNGIAYTILAIQRNESGDYICIVNVTLNPTHGHKVVRSGLTSITIDVLYEPFIKAYEQETVLETQVANLTCKVVGNPKPTVTWIYSPTNHSFTESDVIHHSSIEVSSILMFPRVSCNKTGSYICVANNGINKPAHKNNYLYVKCLPRLAIYSVPHRNLTVKKNGSLNFTEWFDAYPQPSFQFFKGNNTEENETHGFDIMNITDNQFLYKRGSRIQKDEFEQSDIGEYVLVAANEIGWFNVSYNIIYTREPDRPINVFANCGDKYRTAIVQWNAGWNGGSVQQFQVLYKRITDNTFSNNTGAPIAESLDDKSYYHSIAGLLSKQNYIFKVRASNVVGFEDSLESNCTTTNTQTSSSSDLMAIGVALGSIFGIAVIVAIAAVLLIRRRKSEKNEKQMELLKSRNDTDNVNDDSEDGLKDNICYVSSHEINNSANLGVEYAVVKKNSSKKDGHNSENEIPRNKKESKQNDAYEIADQGLKNKASTSNEPKRNKDGLQYADLVFDNPSGKRKFVIIGQENRTNYSDIDFTQRADPLPDDDEDEDLTETDVRNDGE